MKKKQIMKTILLTLSVMFSPLLAGCGEKPAAPRDQTAMNGPSSVTLNGDNNAEDEPQAGSPLTVGIMPDIDSIPFIVAQERGYFSENITLEVFKSPMDRDSALSSGSIDGTISDVLAVCLAREGDFEVYITSMTNGRYGVIARPESAIDSPRQLEGKDVAMSLNTVIEYVTDRMVTAQGGDPALVKKASVPQIPSRLELLSNKQIDAAAMPEPFLEAALSSGHVLVASSSELEINPGIMLFTAAAIADKTAELKAFYTAYNQAVAYINMTDPAEFMPDVITALGLPESADKVKLPVYDSCRLPDKEQVEAAQEWLKERELIKNDYSYEELVQEIKVE
jgi:NitT/TauT family transport system substrate-binding protein